jgi:hypothetical protein
VSSLPARDERATGRVRRSRFWRPWVSRRTLIIFWALWLPIVGFMLITPRLAGSSIRTPHPGEPELNLSLVNGSSHDVALVIADEDNDERDVEWLGDTSHVRLEQGRPGERLTLSVVASDFAAGPAAQGECDLVVPASGFTRILVRDDGSGTVIEPDDEAAQQRLVVEALQAASTAPDAEPPQPFGVRVVNGTSRRLHATFRAEDGTVFEQAFHGRSHTFTLPRPLVPGERLHATWQVAAPGDLSLQVRVFPDGRWEIGEPSILALLRVKLAMFAAVFIGD